MGVISLGDAKSIYAKKNGLSLHHANFITLVFSFSSWAFSRARIGLLLVLFNTESEAFFSYIHSLRFNLHSSIAFVPDTFFLSPFFIPVYFPFHAFFIHLYITSQLLILSFLFYFCTFYLFSLLLSFSFSLFFSLSILLSLASSHHQLVTFHQCGFRL